MANNRTLKLWLREPTLVELAGLALGLSEGLGVIPASALIAQLAVVLVPGRYAPLPASVPTSLFWFLGAFALCGCVSVICRRYIRRHRSRQLAATGEKVAIWLLVIVAMLLPAVLFVLQLVLPPGMVSRAFGPHSLWWLLVAAEIFLAFFLILAWYRRFKKGGLALNVAVSVLCRWAWVILIFLMPPAGWLVILHHVFGGPSLSPEVRKAFLHAGN